LQFHITTSLVPAAADQVNVQQLMAFITRVQQLLPWHSLLFMLSLSFNVVAASARQEGMSADHKVIATFALRANPCHHQS
jgi:hypothetical protein